MVKMQLCKIVPGFIGILAGVLVVQGAPAYRLVDDMVIVEAEDLEPSPMWEKRSSPAGFSGSGWMQYVGPHRRPASNSSSPDDNLGEYQGSESDWLKIPVYIDKPGMYCMQIRSYHTTRGEPVLGFDCTVWTHVKNYPLPVRFSHGRTERPNAFDWLGYGPSMLIENDRFDQVHARWGFRTEDVPCIATFYVAGRDQGFGADRIHIYRMIGNPAKDKHAAYPANLYNVNAPLSVLQDVDAVLFNEEVGVVAPLRPALMAGAGSSSLQVFDLRGRSGFKVSRSAFGVHLQNSDGGHCRLHLLR